MRRFATALIALLATVALVTAAGSFGEPAGPSLDGGDSLGPAPTETREVPPPRRAGGNGTDAGDEPTEPPSGTGPAGREPGDGDGSGISSLVVVLLVGSALVAAVLAVLLTDDDSRAPPPERGDEGGADGPATPAVDPGYDSPPDNAVVRAWRRLVERVEGVEASATPGETAERAAAVGLPDGPVHGITDEFVSVRYGREPPSPERERRADRLADRLDGDRESDGGERS
ncbi:MAG: DUF4129 domain-containing protein [Halosimplex sp.]